MTTSCATSELGRGNSARYTRVPVGSSLQLVDIGNTVAVAVDLVGSHAVQGHAKGSDVPSDQTTDSHGVAEGSDHRSQARHAAGMAQAARRRVRQPEMPLDGVGKHRRRQRRRLGEQQHDRDSEQPRATHRTPHKNT